MSLRKKRNYIPIFEYNNDKGGSIINASNLPEGVKIK
jgi:hypothetical protein